MKKIIKNDNTTYYQYLGECHEKNHIYLKCDSCGKLTHVDCGCIKELTEVRPEKLDDKGLKLFKAIMQIIEERDELRVQRDYYKKMYAEFNNAFIQGGRKLTEE